MEGVLKRLVASLTLALLLPVSAFSLTYSEIRSAYKRSYIYERSRDYTDAIKALMPIYENYPNGYTVNLRLGWLYYLSGRYADSEFHYRKALQAIPTSVEAILGLMLPLMAEDKWSQVESLAYRILKTDYYNYYGNLRLSVALRHQNKFSMAEAVDRKMLTLYPTDVNFLNELALSLLGEGKKLYAKTIFENVLILDPENVTARNYLMRLVPSQKHLKESEGVKVPSNSGERAKSELPEGSSEKGKENRKSKGKEK